MDTAVVLRFQSQESGHIAYGWFPSVEAARPVKRAFSAQMVATFPAGIKYGAQYAANHDAHVYAADVCQVLNRATRRSVHDEEGVPGFVAARNRFAGEAFGPFVK